MDPHHPEPPLSRRERQIMDILYARGRASAADVREALPDPPSYSATRALLRVLEEKGHITHEQAGRSYVYRPVQPRGPAARAALTRVVQTFFAGSAERAMAALMDLKGGRLEPKEAQRLQALIDAAREEEEEEEQSDDAS